jgi:hypothetical protein
VNFSRSHTNTDQSSRLFWLLPASIPSLRKDLLQRHLTCLRPCSTRPSILSGENAIQEQRRNRLGSRSHTLPDLYRGAYGRSCQVLERFANKAVGALRKRVRQFLDRFAGSVLERLTNLSNTVCTVKGPLNPRLVLRVLLAGPFPRLLRVCPYEATHSIRALPAMDPFVQTFEVVLFPLKFFPKLGPLLVSLLLLSIAPFAFLLLPSKACSGSQKSRHKNRNEPLKPLDLSIAPPLSLLELAPGPCNDEQHQLSRGFVCDDLVVVPTVCWIGNSRL